MNPPAPLTGWSTRLWAALGAAALLAAMTVPGRAGEAAERIRAAHAAEALLARVRDPGETARLERALAALRRERLGGDRTPQRPAEVLRTLRDAALLADVDVLTVRPGERTPQGGFDAWAVELELAGAYHDVGRFLAFAERPPLQARTHRLELAPPRPPAAPAEWRLASPERLRARALLLVALPPSAQPGGAP